MVFAGPYCGDVSPGQVAVPLDHAYVIFTTDDSDEFQGFILDWVAMCRCSFYSPLLELQSEILQSIVF